MADSEVKKISEYLEEDKQKKIDDKYLTDLNRSDKTSMALHNSQYDKLLRVYVEKTEKTFKFRILYAKWFLWVSLIILWVILILLCLTVYFSMKSEMAIEKISVLIPVSISFLTVYIVIPKIITNYLFNEKEEEYTANVIGNIQEFDKEVRRNLIETELWRSNNERK